MPGSEEAGKTGKMFKGLEGRWSVHIVVGFMVIMITSAFLAGRSTAFGSPAVQEHDHASGLDETQSADLWFTCSMHPQVRTNDPSERCPICGMELIPVVAASENEGDPSLPVLTVSPRSAALMQVEVYPVERSGADRSLRLYGQVAFDETRVRTIASRVPGRLDRLHVDFTGQEVQLGDPMALVYSPTLVATQEELLQSLAAQRQLPPDPSSSLEAGTASRVAAVRDKLRLLGLSPEQIGEIERGGRVEETLTLLAPADGIVISREAMEGSYVEEGQTIYTLSDLSRVWVTLEVHEGDAGWVRVGQEVAFNVEAFPGERFLGNVAFVQPTVHNESRTVELRVDLPNPAGRLKPGMFVTGEVLVPLGGSGSTSGTATSLLIPASAPLLTGERALVYVQLPDTETPTFEGRDVVLGPRAGDRYVVLEGLHEGELVVTRGNFKIDSELQIRGQPSMMAPQGGGAPTHEHESPGPTPAQATSGAQTHEHAAPEPPSAQTPSAFSEQLGAVVKVNFELVRWLSGDDPEESRRAATTALQALGKVDASLLDGAHGDIWAPLRQGMQEGLTAMVGEQDFEEMRVPHFEQFSDSLTQAVRVFGTGSVAPVYRAMCPMVKGREGFWLQANQEVTNPYHGSRMFSCGDIVETLVDIGG